MSVHVVQQYAGPTPSAATPWGALSVPVWEDTKRTASATVQVWMCGDAFAML